MRDTDFEPGQVYETYDGGEVWLITAVDLARGKVSHLILFSHASVLIGRHSWFYPSNLQPRSLERFNQIA